VPKQIRDLLRAEVEDGRFRLADVDPVSTPGLIHKKRALKELPKQHAPLFKLQEKLYAERKKALLLVLQGMDTSGKNPDRDAEGDGSAVPASQAGRSPIAEAASGVRSSGREKLLT
jgi:hypothetical protein